MSNSLIEIKNNELIFDSLKFDYELITNEIIDKNQRLFKLKISTKKSSNIETFLELLKIIRELTYKTEGKLSIIWDDISNYYSHLAYPEINKIENLLRKLITYFMISKFGFEWSDESTPIEVKNNIKNKRDKNNYLHDTDFIQLADFLFKPYSNKSTEIMFRELKKRVNLEGLDIEYFNQFIPKSNWERYFNEFVDCEDGFLSKNWTRLYELRCLIAHNSFISKSEFEELNEIVEILKDKIEKAIISIDKIIIPKNEKSAVLESVVKVKNELLEKYFSVWNEIYDEILNLYINKGFDKSEKSLKEIVEELVENNILSQEFYNELLPLGLIRNKLNHIDENLTDSEILKATEDLQYFNFNYVFLTEPFLSNYKETSK
ncbi:MAG: hypothetical protein ACOVNP_08325 [Flavobacterium sp.]